MDNKKIFGVIVVIVIIAIIGIAYSTGSIGSQSSNENGTVEVLAGAGFSEMGPDMIKEFNKKYPNVKVNVKYAGSGELYSTLETQHQGDVFLPAAYKYMGKAMKNGYMENSTVKNVTTNVPVIVVQKGNPKNITSVKDLNRTDIKVGIGEENGPAIGKTTAAIISKNNITGVNPAVKTTTVNQLLTYVVSGQVDVVIIWEDMTVWNDTKDKIDVIEIPEKENNISTIPIGVTKYGKNNTAAEKFTEFVVSDEGKEVWKKWGFEPL
ncbi:molybdate ABC transporter substrate-binding protein [Methanobrevibacter sp. 87.7]|uniref:molybdate ABC transporter substrate-binding protein n=1 Tax=Methanobrevibacter sp. 87.7 TaxID=387957 RepID=UPI000B5125B6|nr:molybdate ABC transporter substrate-binding protein [Methanobrevibacter sp. 87.7]OWT32579.1 molybdate ABC transporter substrate-binding protein [Methanobrevibacter sp. 87.7]